MLSPYKPTMNRDIAQSPVHSASSAPLPIIEVRKVSQVYFAHKSAARLQALDQIDLTINRGEVVGLVGESGCGKSTLARIISSVRLPTSGRVLFQGRELSTLSGREKIDAKLKVQMIFQDPYASLNPRMNVAEIIAEAPRLHGLIDTNDREFVDRQMQRTGLDPSYKVRYPHQFSGGQRQRIGIARALAVSPDVLVCDEPVSALDVSIQAQILNLFMDLREQLRLTFLFISHDLSVVRHFADRVVIMYLGRIVEEAPAREIFSTPNHPYTQGLIAEMPRIVTQRRAFDPIKGEIPSPSNPPTGCHFHPRCPQVMAICSKQAPEFRQIGANRYSACHLNDIAVKTVT
jgi:oligopeptide/dipeptide ABC transporter ATP-binding protein